MPQSRSLLLQRTGAGVWRGAPCLAGVLLIAACSELTDVDTELVEREALENAEGALALRAGAFAQFGTFVRFGIQAPTSLFTDELTVTGLAGSSSSRAVDDRTLTEQNPGDAGFLFAGWQVVLVRVDDAVNAMRRHAPEPASRIGDLFALRGYTLVSLAEDFCAGLPIATFRDGRPVPGVPHSTAELLELALAAFDTAAALAGDSLRLAQWAAVGRGRALLDMGRFTDAAAAVADVPTAFTLPIFEPVSGSPGNSLFFNFPARTVADREGGNGLPFVSTQDPRLGLQPAGERGGATSWRPAKYATAALPIVLADGVEARLIEAEAALEAGDVDGWLTIHNGLRADLGLPPLVDPGTAPARVDLHFSERAFWLFMTGHRLGDLRRLIRQYGRDAETVLPTGLYKEGPEPYGSATHLPVPEDERRSPNFTGCLAEP